jgi:formylglycine-generating enzyme required for sulfatase activity
MGQETIDPIVKALADHVDDSNWHEVILLTIGYLGIIQQRDEAAGAVLQKLLDEAPEKPGQAVVLAGEALLDIGAEGVTPQSRLSIIQALSDTMLDEPRTSPVIRASAGRLFGRLGEDRRRGVGFKEGLPDIDWVPVKAGPFIMGSDKKKDPDAYESEMPQFECTLIQKSYRISRYPITVAQYQAFIDDRGYEKEQFWTRAGWRWRTEGNIRNPKSYDEVFQTPNHPRVGVSWYEAVAFCNWLSGKMGHPISLPSEAQWEKAARGGDGRIYPWGNKFDSGKCNMWNTGINSTSAVGIFPTGNKKGGAADLAGNVWEWCRTKGLENYQDYENKVNDDIEGDEARVLRGGSFYHSPFWMRCDSRFGDVPLNRVSFIGFRVIAPGL